MKKLLFSLVAFLTVAALNAQMIRGNTITERTKFGVKAGLSAPYWQEEQYGVGYFTYDIKAGFVVGVEAEIPIKSGWYLQPEANYAQMGAQIHGEFNDDATNQKRTGLIKYKNDYVQVPVLIKYRPLYSGFGVYFGPQAGFLTQAKENPVNFNPITTTDEYTKMDFSGVFGVEYYFPNMDDSKPRFGISGRYVHGFTNIYPDNSDLANDYRLSNKGFQLTLGVRF